jgi:hypothetical protein
MKTFTALFLRLIARYRSLLRLAVKSCLPLKALLLSSLAYIRGLLRRFMCVSCSVLSCLGGFQLSSLLRVLCMAQATYIRKRAAELRASGSHHSHMKLAVYMMKVCGGLRVKLDGSEDFDAGQWLTDAVHNKIEEQLFHNLCSPTMHTLTDPNAEKFAVHVRFPFTDPPTAVESLLLAMLWQLRCDICHRSDSSSRTTFGKWGLKWAPTVPQNDIGEVWMKHRGVDVPVGIVEPKPGGGGGGGGGVDSGLFRITLPFEPVRGGASEDVVIVLTVTNLARKGSPKVAETAIVFSIAAEAVVPLCVKVMTMILRRFVGVRERS